MADYYDDQRITTDAAASHLPSLAMMPLLYGLIECEANRSMN